jgi:hypothetical protein
MTVVIDHGLASRREQSRHARRDGYESDQSLSRQPQIPTRHCLTLIRRRTHPNNSCASCASCIRMGGESPLEAAQVSWEDDEHPLGERRQACFAVVAGHELVDAAYLYPCHGAEVEGASEVLQVAVVESCPYLAEVAAAELDHAEPVHGAAVVAFAVLAAACVP